ncbi:uncharacterized protein LOC124467266 isoform X2 [Hypomesus transpacificus]|uniref:uncharacterized protein LOC124467266 isoform X2 n=1 Tax=Hypomesus transpacificus TaxID=137520 RepID=UPI001F07D20B|nr:uncharacterized protein LOC124467266 isoform X2 [Hypomesus transpacificus]
MAFAGAILVVYGMLGSVNTESHSLEYVYTALSKPIHHHGIHEFTAMGLLNDRMIDYYDNDLQKKVPKQDWMEEKLDKDYWDKGTQSRKFKEQWFKVNIGILMDRMRQNDSDVHTLQWRHGCEVEEEQGSVRFIKGFDQYSYDGDDFLAFDDTSTQWIAPNAAAVPTKRKWDGEQILNQYTKGYLEKECVDWLNKFMDYGQKSLRQAKPPIVEAYGKKSKTVGNVKLTCWATGFLPKDISLNIRKNGVVISDGVETSGVRPNHDGTHQIWKRVEIPMDDQENYDCFVEHQALVPPIIKAFPDNKCGDCPLVKVGTISVVVGFIICLALVGGLMFILYKRGIVTLSRRKPSDPVLNRQPIYSPPGGAAAPSALLPTSNLVPDKKEGSDGSSNSGHSSGGTPSPTGSTQSIDASAGTADESTAPLLNKESTQHMDVLNRQPIYSPPGGAAAPSALLPTSNLVPDKKEGSDGSSDSGHSSGGTPSPTGSTQSIDASAGNSSGGTPSLTGSSVVIVVSAGTADESTAPLLNKESTQHMDVLNRQPIYSPPGGAAAPSALLPTSNLVPDKKEGSDGSSDSGHSSGGTPSPTGSTQSIDASAGNSSGGTPSLTGSSVVIVVSAGTADESTAPLLNKESTQHMDGNGTEPKENKCAAQQPLLGSS